MAVTLTSGEIQRRGGTFQSVENLNCSTATTLGTIALDKDVTTLSTATATSGGATATGATINRFLCAAGVEGQEKTVIALGTMEAKIQFAGGTATGSYVLSAADDFVFMKYINGGWKAIADGTATLATATEPA